MHYHVFWHDNRRFLFLTVYAPEGDDGRSVSTTIVMDARLADGIARDIRKALDERPMPPATMTAADLGIAA